MDHENYISEVEVSEKLEPVPWVGMECDKVFLCVLGPHWTPSSDNGNALK